MAYSPGSQQVGSIVRYTQQFQNTTGPLAAQNQLLGTQEQVAAGQQAGQALADLQILADDDGCNACRTGLEIL